MILPSPGYCVGIFLILLVVVNGTDCPAGKYSQTAGTNCKICQRSRYTDQTDRSSCKWCSAGKYIADHESSQSEHNSANDCDKCPKGRYRALVVTIVTQVNTCQVTTPAIMQLIKL